MCSIATSSWTKSWRICCREGGRNRGERVGEGGWERGREGGGGKEVRRGRRKREKRGRSE